MVTMNYKKHDEIPAIPADLAKECIDYAIAHMAAKAPMIAWYRNYETTNVESLSYVKPGTELDETNGDRTAGIGFSPVPENLNQRLVKFCKETGIELINFDVFTVQIVIDGKFLAPHIDDPALRNAGMLYMLKAGGTNVTTSWYDIKPKYAISDITYNAAIPYSRLDLIESHCLEENTWHWLDFTHVHGVQHQESIRIALWAYKIP